jgi:hypothetical protein
MKYVCLICGFPDLRDPPRSARTGGGSYEICPSCGFEFGVTDDDLGFTYDQWRQRWIDSGMPWESIAVRPPPAEWDPQAHLRRLLKPS